MKPSSPLQVEDGKVYEIHDFIRTQADHRANKASSQIEMMIGRIASQLEKAIAEVKRSEARLREAVLEDSKDPSNGATKGLSSAKVKVERMEREQQYRAVVKNMAQLPNIIRLVDYMTVTGLVQMLAEFVESIRSLFQQRSVFSVSINFNTEAAGYVFEPEAALLQEKVDEDLCAATAEMVKLTPRVLHWPTFRELFEVEGRKPVGPDINSVIMTFKRLSLALAECDGLIDASYSEARKYSSSFNELRTIAAFGLHWSEAEYSSKERDVTQFRQDMLLMRTWAADIAGMTLSHKCGMVEVDATEMQEGLKGLVDSALDTMRGLLITAAQTECQRCFQSFQSTTKGLTKRPQDLDGFCNFLDESQRVDETREQLLTEAALVDEMYDMLTSYNAKIPEQDKLALDDLRDLLTQFNKENNESRTFLDENKEDMVERLESEVAKVIELTHSVSTKARPRRSPKVSLMMGCLTRPSRS